MPDKFTGAPIKPTNRAFLWTIGIILLCGILSVAVSLYCLMHGTIARYATAIILIDMATAIMVIVISPIFRGNRKRAKNIRSTHVR